MAKADIQVQLSDGAMEGDLVRYGPGQRIRGAVRVTAQSDVSCPHLYVRLGWHTEGRGDRDGRTIAELDVFQGSLSSGIATMHEFHFELPSEPWSYAGHYVNIIWEIEVEVDVPWALNPRHSQPFVMAPPLLTKVIPVSRDEKIRRVRSLLSGG